MTAEEWHWFRLTGVEAVSLYANPLSPRSAAGIQWILPGFSSAWRNFSEGLAMKGLWSKDRVDTRGYKPALDALKAIDREILTSALLAVVENGCALMIGATRDHGAISLILMDGNERHKLYPSDVGELQQALLDLIASLSPSNDSGRPSGAKKR